MDTGVNILDGASVGTSWPQPGILRWVGGMIRHTRSSTQAIDRDERAGCAGVRNHEEAVRERRVVHEVAWRDGVGNGLDELTRQLIKEGQIRPTTPLAVAGKDIHAPLGKEIVADERCG